MIHVGIDPDLTKNGVAIMEDGQYKELLALTFPQLIELIKTAKKETGILFVVENVNKVKPTYFRGTKNRAIENNISQKVGMVKAVGAKIIEMLEHYGVPYTLSDPLKGTLKKCKSDAKLFEKLTGWEGRTNADKRDAAMLIYKYKK